VRSPRLLVVEDDESLAMVLRDALERAGHVVEVVPDGPAALDRATTRRFDLVVLDLMLPGLDGYEVCKRVRAAGRDVPILILTARGREEDRVRGFELGADDYVVKPFSLKELLARVEARLRGRRPAPPPRVRLGGAEVDLTAMVVRRDGRAEPLTRLENGVLRLLLAHPGEVLTRNRFLDEVWGFERFPTTRTVDVHVARVREKIGDAGDPPWIATVHGVGYRFDPPEGFRPDHEELASR
jgi:DNA-binding response OmpR family regulator